MAYAKKGDIKEKVDMIREYIELSLGMVMLRNIIGSIINSSVSFTTKTMALCAMIVLFLTGVATEAEAKHAKHKAIESFGDWKVVNNPKNQGCFIYTVAQRTRGKTDIEDRAYIYFKKVGYKSYTFAVLTSAPAKKSKGVILETDQRYWELQHSLTQNAWTYSSVQDVDLINELMLSKQSVRVKYYDEDENGVLEYFSLKGLPAAYKALGKCVCDEASGCESTEVYY